MKNLCITTDLNCTEPGAEVSVIGNSVTIIKKCMWEAGLEALPVPVESLRRHLCLCCAPIYCNILSVCVHDAYSWRNKR